jgi:RND family efflux transporter MFP subunit
MTNEPSERPEPEQKIATIHADRKVPASSDWMSETLGLLRTRTAFYAIGGLSLAVFGRMGVNWYEHRGVAALTPRVQVIHPLVKTLDTALTLPGNIEAIQQASLYAHVGGYLKKIFVDEGDTVRKDQLLALIDAPDIIQEFNKAKAEYGLKEVTLKRYAELLKEKVVSQQEFDTVTADAETAKARLENASANVAFTRIIAPFAGSIARRFKYPGDLISATQRGNESPIFMLVNEGTLRVVVNVPQSELANIGLGHAVDVRVDTMPNEKFEGVISRLDALLDEATKTQRVLIDLKNPLGKLHAGMFASVVLHIEHREGAMTVPREVIKLLQGKSYVLTAKDGRAVRVPVTLGISDETTTEITQGITPADLVISGGGAEVDDGSAVELIERK